MAEWTGRNAAGEIVTVRFAPVYAGQVHPNPNDTSNPIHSGNATGMGFEFSAEYRGANGGNGPGGVPGFPDPASGMWVEDWTGVTSMYGSAGARGVELGYLNTGDGPPGLAGGTGPGGQDDLPVPPAAQGDPSHPWWGEQARGPGGAVLPGAESTNFALWSEDSPYTRSTPAIRPGGPRSPFVPHGQAIDNWEKKIVGGGDALELGSHTAVMNETLLSVGIDPVDFHAGNVSEDMLLAASGQGETAVEEAEQTILTEPDEETVDYFSQPGTAKDWALKHFPWAVDLNLGDMIVAAITEGTDTEVMIAQIRDTPNYRATFPGITDEQGRMRFLDESSYVDQVRAYRNVLKDAGTIGGRRIFDPTKENPVDYATLMERGISTEELASRLDTYRQLTNNSAGVRAAFKTYANMEVGIDQLYQAVADPEAGSRLVGEYNQNVLDADFDYSNWVANATQAALDATMETLQNLRTGGIVDEGIMARINALTHDMSDQGHAQGLVEALYLGNPDDEDPLLELDELVEAFQFALIGGAATEQGLIAPSAERVRAIRQAGIDRATALKAYGAFSGQRNLLGGMVGRTNVQGEGNRTFTQEDFEEALFLNQAPEVDLLTRARQGEMSRARAPGGFATTAQGARLAQPGRTAPTRQ